MEPDRKRGYYDNSSSSHQKRARPDDFHHPSGSAYVPQGPEVYSRLFLNQSTFAKVIGKGGAMIKNIRQQYGASMKGVDVNEEERMLVVSGTFVQVMDTFDAVSDILHSSHLHNSSNPGNDVFSLALMIESSRAGRIIGQKGSTMQTLKATTHAVQLSLNKEALEVMGQQYRLLTIAGPLSTVRRAHYLVLDLLYDFAALVSRVGIQGLGPVRGATMSEMLMGVTQGPPPGFSDGRNELPNVIPLPQLNSRTGLHVDVVNQLADMQAYIGQFGLEMLIVDKRAPPPQAPILNSPPVSQTSMPPASLSYSRGEGSSSLIQAQAQHVAGGGSNNSGNSIEFLIPKEKVGAVIGKGGQGLREIRQETGCKVNVSREEMRGMRLVTVHHENHENMARAQELVLQRAAACNTESPVKEAMHFDNENI